MANENIYFLASDQETGRNGALGYDQGLFMAGKKDAFDLQGALRFQVTLAQGTTVSLARLYMYVQFRGVGSNLKVIAHGFDEDNTADLSSNPFGRSQTSASNTIDSAIVSVGSYQEMEVTTIVNEILARGGWSSGNSMGFAIENNGSADNIYLEDDNGISYLMIRAEAEPNFTPTPKSVSPSPIPPSRNVGMKMSYPGKNVLIASESELYFISRKKKQFKVFKEGRFVSSGAGDFSIPHALGYIPFTSVYCKSSIFGNFWVKLPLSWDANSPNYYMDKYNIYFHSTTSGEEFYYRVFLDKLSP